MTSARVTCRPWRLVFERRSPPVIDHLMGYCGGGDTLTQVQLDFPSLDAAVAFAEKQGLDYVVRADPPERPRPNVRDPFGKTAAHSLSLQHQGREVKQR
jgi:hypothetical protein